MQPIHTIGKGCPDLLLGIDGHNVLVEVKDGSKVPSARKLTDDEAAWHAAWRGQVAVIESEWQLMGLITEHRERGE